MACMYGRYRRVCGVGVRCVQALAYGAMACVGTVCRRWVYVWCTLCMCRVVYVVCTCVCRSMTW